MTTEGRVRLNVPDVDRQWNNLKFKAKKC